MLQKQNKIMEKDTANALSRILLAFNTVYSKRDQFTKIIEYERTHHSKLFYLATKRVTKLKNSKALFAIEFKKTEQDPNPISFHQYLKNLYYDANLQSTFNIYSPS